MKLTKSNVRRGTTAAAGGNAGSGSATPAAVDLSSVITAIDGNAGDIEALRNEVAQLRQQLASITAAMLRKDDDDSNNGHTLRLGAVVTDTLMSNVYDSGHGASLGMGGDAAAPEWMMVLRNIANRVDKTAPMADTIGEGVTYDTSVASATQTLWDTTASVTVSNSTAGAMLRVKAGITAGNGVTLLEQHLHYSVGQVISGRSKQASTQPRDIIADNPEAVNIGGDVWQLPLEDANSFGDTFVYSFVYQATYRVEVGSVSQTVRLYIKGTQGDGTTRYFGGAACQLLAYADSLQLTADGAGIVVRPAGIYRRAADGTETQLL